MKSYHKCIIISLLLFSLLLLFSCSKLFPTIPDATQKSGVLYLDPANLNISPGEKFTIDLKIGAIDNLKGYSVTLNYDTTLINPVEITEGSFFSSSGETFFYKDINPEEGTILIDCAILGRGKNVSGEGTLATISLTSLKSGSVTIDFVQAKARSVENKGIVITREKAVIRSK
jgi:hypothetical protein